MKVGKLYATTAAALIAFGLAPAPLAGDAIPMSLVRDIANGNVVACISVPAGLMLPEAAGETLLRLEISRGGIEIVGEVLLAAAAPNGPNVELCGVTVQGHVFATMIFVRNTVTEYPGILTRGLVAVFLELSAKGRRLESTATMLQAPD